jgi:hypothetical protein
MSEAESLLVVLNAGKAYPWMHGAHHQTSVFAFARQLQRRSVTQKPARFFFRGFAEFYLKLFFDESLR